MGIFRSPTHVDKPALACCERCSLRPCSCVLSSGPEKAELVIVGEAPGSEEITQRVPFAYRDDGSNAGYLLWDCLGQVGITREQVFVTNVVCCRPPGNRAPTKDETSACHDRLLSEIARRAPRMVLMLGNTALHALARTTKGITQARMYDWEIDLGDLRRGDRKALGVATYHPAAVLRNGNLGIDFARDLDLFIARLRGADIAKDTGRLLFTRVDSLESLRAISAMIPDDEAVAVDLETTGFNPRQNEIICLTLAWDDYSVVVDGALVQDQEGRAALDALLDRVTQVYHNGKFDVAFLQKAGFENARIDGDTMLQSYALDERQGVHSLKNLSRLYFGAEDYESEVQAFVKKNKGATYAGVPRDVLETYAAKDGHYTIKLHRELGGRLSRDKELEQLYAKILLPAARVTREMEKNGLLVDHEYLELLGARYTDELKELEKLLHGLAGRAFNPASPSQVLTLLKEKRLLSSSATTTNKAVLAALESRSPFAANMLAWRRTAKKKTSYVDTIRPLIEPDGRVYPNYLIHGTVSGRFSTTNPAIHTIPKEGEMRDLFIAPPSWRLVEADFDQMELRICAHYSGDNWLKQVFRDGRKLHAEVARAMYGEGFTDAQYRVAKSLNFGILYGMTEYGLAPRIGVSTDEARDYLADWFARMPQVQQYLERVKAQALATGELCTVFGRRRRFGWITEETKHAIEKEATNYAIQSTASDLTLLCLIEISPKLRRDCVRPIIFMHDALIFEVREDVVESFVPWLSAEMARIPYEALRTDVPFKTDIKVGLSWGGMK